MEAISVVCEFERINEYFTARINRSGEMVEFGNINAYENFMRLYIPFLKSDTMMSNIDYHRRLDRIKYSE